MKILLFISILTLVQAKEIRLIDNETGDPIKNVNVYTDKYGTTTDENGYCSLELFDEIDDITFSMIGYETITKRYEEINKILYMHRQTIPMELVTVFAKDKKSKKDTTDWRGMLEKYIHTQKKHQSCWLNILQ